MVQVFDPLQWLSRMPGQSASLLINISSKALTKSGGLLQGT